MKEIKPKLCPECSDEYIQFQSFQKCCTKFSCMQSVAKKKKVKEEKQKHIKLKRNHYDNDRSHWIKKAQAACNAYIRYRDRFLGCVSCGTTKDVQYCAGHFKTRGAHSELRFNEANIQKQCNKNCNLSLSGNIANYRLELINRIGLAHVEYLESSNTPYKYTTDDLKDIFKYYKDKLNMINK